ncbi:MAG: hypothetical protein U9P14_01560 [Gemmatimonadota bacterium]|nr:hypothetical protein [Gemmatimonadota bacterium]
MEIGREMIDRVFRETDIQIQVGSRLMANQETVLNYLVLAPSVENEVQTIRWDGRVRVSPRMTISADEHASISLLDFYGSKDKVPPPLQDVSIAFRNAYLHLEKEVHRQHMAHGLEESIGIVRNVFDRITSHRSGPLEFENNALIVAPSEFVWPVSVLKYVSEVVGEDFRSFHRYGM